MYGCQLDTTLQRHEIDGFKFPLGVYPVDPMTPRAGYTLQFEPADGDEPNSDWEEWPDRYLFDIVLSAERVEPLCHQLFAMLPGRIFPIIDVLGHDAYREIDPYMAYELVPHDIFSDHVRRFRNFFYEDGMCGFGALAEEPFFYIFIDEHKIITIRAEPSLKERIEKLLKAFDLEEIEDPAGADAASHEHRSVLKVPDDKPDLLGPEEIVEHLRDEWNLILNVDPDSNVDDEGKDLGTTPWRCVVRVEREEARRKPREDYAEILLYAHSVAAAEEAALGAVDKLIGSKRSAISDVVVVAADRLTPNHMTKLLGETKKGKSKASEDSATTSESGKADASSKDEPTGKGSGKSSGKGSGGGGRGCARWQRPIPKPIFQTLHRSQRASLRNGQVLQVDRVIAL